MSASTTRRGNVISGKSDTGMVSMSAAPPMTSSATIKNIALDWCFIAVKYFIGVQCLAR